MTKTLDTLAAIIHHHAQENNMTILRLNYCQQAETWFCTYYEGRGRTRQIQKICSTHPLLSELIAKVMAFLDHYPSKVTEIAHPRDQVYLMWGSTRHGNEERLWYQPVDLASS